MDCGEVSLMRSTSRNVKSYVPRTALESLMLSGVGSWFVDKVKCQLQTTGEILHGQDSGIKRSK